MATHEKDMVEKKLGKIKEAYIDKARAIIADW